MDAKTLTALRSSIRKAESEVKFLKSFLPKTRSRK